ncbi:hypothetical protein, partial [Antrihabitans cavernicola]|uniref:hypothetical protein n=1 Tax=Antrihabitans cavernicola TaxID=2495913 RepID=UPI001658F3D8
APIPVPTPEVSGGLICCDDPEFAEKFWSGQLDLTLAEQQQHFYDEVFATPTPPRRHKQLIADEPVIDLDELAPF